MSVLDRLSDLERLIDAGCFEGEYIELLEGVIVTMSPKLLHHSSVVMLLNELLIPLLDDETSLRVHSLFAASEISLPKPDVALIPRRDYRHERPSEAFLIIEVALESLRKDRRLKSELYARAGVPEYWIVNLVENVVEIYTDPRDGAYENMRTVGSDGKIRLVALPAIEVAVADFVK
jgi:Uma2 family endonuclease